MLLVPPSSLHIATSLARSQLDRAVVEADLLDLEFHYDCDESPHDGID